MSRKALLLFRRSIAGLKQAQQSGEDGVAVVDREVELQRLEDALPIIGAVAEVAGQDILVTAAERNADGQITEIRHRKNWPYVKHFYFHLIDPEWGHVSIRTCSYPPFGAQVILNGHEWLPAPACAATPSG